MTKIGPIERDGVLVTFIPADDVTVDGLVRRFKHAVCESFFKDGHAFLHAGLLVDKGPHRGIVFVTLVDQRVSDPSGELLPRVRALASGFEAYAAVTACECWIYLGRGKEDLKEFHRRYQYGDVRRSPDRKECLLVSLECGRRIPTSQVWIARIDRSRAEPSLAPWEAWPAGGGKLMDILPPEAYGQVTKA